MTNKQIVATMQTLPMYSERTAEQMKLSDELSCRGMINSCLVYGMRYAFYDANTQKFGHYAQFHVENLGEETVMRLWNEQLEDFSNAVVTSDVYTDSERCKYNSCKWADDEQ